jgi:hypothetical protein
MKMLNFTFKNEAKWMMIFSLAIPLLGIVIGLAIVLWKRL